MLNSLSTKLGEPHEPPIGWRINYSFRHASAKFLRAIRASAKRSPRRLSSLDGGLAQDTAIEANVVGKVSHSLSQD